MLRHRFFDQILHLLCAVACDRCQEQAIIASAGSSSWYFQFWCFRQPVTSHTLAEGTTNLRIYQKFRFRIKDLAIFMFNWGPALYTHSCHRQGMNTFHVLKWSQTTRIHRESHSKSWFLDIEESFLHITEVFFQNRNSLQRSIPRERKMCKLEIKTICFHVSMHTDSFGPEFSVNDPALGVESGVSWNLHIRQQSWESNFLVEWFSEQIRERHLVCCLIRRNSLGTYIANRVSDKISYLADKIFICRSGSAADTQAIADIVRMYVSMTSFRLIFFL